LGIEIGVRIFIIKFRLRINKIETCKTQKCQSNNMKMFLSNPTACSSAIGIIPAIVANVIIIRLLQGNKPLHYLMHYLLNYFEQTQESIEKCKEMKISQEILEFLSLAWQWDKAVIKAKELLGDSYESVSQSVFAPLFFSLDLV